jgi:hypothetical protein
MSETLTKISSRISELEKELSELRIAERVCRSFENGRGKTESARLPVSPSNGVGERVIQADLKGRTVIEAIKQILSEAAVAIHFKEIYERAALRGYRGRKPGKDNTATFWAALNRNKDLFSATGEGNYVLAEKVKAEMEKEKTVE